MIIYSLSLLHPLTKMSEGEGGSGGGGEEGEEEKENEGSFCNFLKREKIRDKCHFYF